MNKNIKVGDKVGFIQRGGYMGKYADLITGKIVDILKDEIIMDSSGKKDIIINQIKIKSDATGKVISRGLSEILTIDDLSHDKGNEKDNI